MNRNFKTFFCVGLAFVAFLFINTSDVSAQRGIGRDRRPPRRLVVINKLRVAMDYDHDGTADYVVFNPTANTWRIVKSGGGTVNVPFGFRSTDYFTPGDFDGDGIGDLPGVIVPLTSAR